MNRRNADQALAACLYEARLSPPAAFKRAVLESCAAIREGRADALAQHASVRRRTVRRTLLVAAALLLLFGAIVACVPAARAEVLSWFGITEPEEYLATDPEAREPNAAMDAMLAAPHPSGPAVAVTETGGIESLSGLLAARLADDGVAFGETLYDGNTLYVALTLQNGFGIWLLEQYCGGTVTRIPIPPEQLEGFFQPEVPEEYLRGEEVYVSPVVGWLYITFPDGTKVGGQLYPLDWSAFPRSGDPQDRDAVNAAFLEANDVVACLEVPLRFDPARYADENGFVAAQASLDLTVELTSPSTDPPALLLRADLGTVQVNATGYRDVSVQSASPDECRWSGTALLTEIDDSQKILQDDGSYAGDVVYTQRELDLDGLRMYDARVQLSPTGNLGAEVALEFPADWTEAQAQLFARRLDFRVFLNGAGPVDGRPEQARELGYRLYNFHLDFDPDDYHKAVFRIGTIVVNHHHLGLSDDADLFAAIESVTLVPTLYTVETLRPFVEVELPEWDDFLDRPVYERQYSGEPIVLEPDVPTCVDAGQYEASNRTVVLSQYAITLPFGVK